MRTENCKSIYLVETDGKQKQSQATQHLKQVKFILNGGKCVNEEASTWFLDRLEITAKFFFLNHEHILPTVNENGSSDQTILTKRVCTFLYNGII